MVSFLITTAFVVAVAVLGLGWGLRWPLWRPMDVLFDPLARVAPRPLTVAQLQRRVLRECTAHISIGVHGSVMAPAHYEVTVALEDLEMVGGVGEWFAQEIGCALGDEVTRRGGSARRVTAVTVVADEDRPRSRPRVVAIFESATRVMDGGDAGASTSAMSGATRTLPGWLMVPEAPGTDDGAIRLTGGPLVIGRSRHADVTVPDPEVSGRHMSLQPGAAGQWVVKDLDSMNGTWLNGRRLQAEHPLSEGDHLRAGRRTWRIERRSAD